MKKETKYVVYIGGSIAAIYALLHIRGKKLSEGVDITLAKTPDRSPADAAKEVATDVIKTTTNWFRKIRNKVISGVTKKGTELSTTMESGVDGVFSKIKDIGAMVTDGFSNGSKYIWNKTDATKKATKSTGETLFIKGKSVMGSIMTFVGGKAKAVKLNVPTRSVAADIEISNIISSDKINYDIARKRSKGMREVSTARRASVRAKKVYQKSRTSATLNIWKTAQAKYQKLAKARWW